MDLNTVLKRGKLDFYNSNSLLFDIETNGLYFDCDLVHSLVVIDINTGEMTSYADQPEYTPIKEGLKRLQEADSVTGHNIVMFDIPALEKIFPDFKLREDCVIFDTLLMSRLFFTDITDKDAILSNKGDMPKKLIGSHGLEAWGYRLGELKGEFGKTSDWGNWSKEMQDYCEQDTKVNFVLFDKIYKMALDYADDAINIEHRFAQIISQQIISGFPFNVEKAQRFAYQLQIEKEKFRSELIEKVPPKVEKTIFIPKANNKKQGYIKGVPFEKVKTTPFNPGSRQQIAERLIEQGWEPTKFTEKGSPCVDEVSLSIAAERFPLAADINRYLLLDKRLGQLANGSQALLKKFRKDTKSIHGDVITNGAVTGRCTHNNPNLAQIPRVKSEYGEEFRSLFMPPEGMVQIGCDASGLELRCLAHYMAFWDNGEYAKVVTEGDPHSANQEAAGLPTRDNAKTFIYGWMYGAGEEKIGSIVMPLGTKTEKIERGKQLNEKFLASIPAIAKLKAAVSFKVKTKGYLVGVDGRKLHVRAEHAALNTLLQSAGAVVMKVANCTFAYFMEKEGFEWGVDWVQMANIHDEFQLGVRPEIADRVSELAVESIRQAGNLLKFNCPLDGEAKIGANWAETH